MLKLNAPAHDEADHEGEALAPWDGNAAVRLLERDDARRALLCERCRPGTRLSEAEADDTAIVVELLPRLRLELRDSHPFRLLADEAARWAEEVPRRYELGGRPFERSLLDLARDVFSSVDPRATFLVTRISKAGTSCMPSASRGS